MGKLGVLAVVAVAAATASAATAPPASAGPTSEEERAACATEIAVLENRRRLFESEGLPAPEQKRRNTAAEQALRDCRRALEERRREGAERATGKPLLIEHERRERRRKLDAEHARDATFMRPAHSGMICYHYARRARAQASLEEERLAGARKADRRSPRAHADLARAEKGLAASHRSIAPFGIPIACDDRTVSALAHCISVANGDMPEDIGCGTEEVQQYLRLLR